jgi:hypothetical protein
MLRMTIVQLYTRKCILPNLKDCIYLPLPITKTSATDVNVAYLTDNF